MDVFVYGTLADPDRAAEVLTSFSYAGDAACDGLHRVEGTYPTLAPGGAVSGRLLRTDDVASLDAYEGVDRGLYVRVSVPRADAGGTSAETYVGRPDRLGVEDPVDWPGTGDFADRVRSYVAERATVRRTDGSE